MMVMRTINMMRRMIVLMRRMIVLMMMVCGGGVKTTSCIRQRLR